MGPQEEHSVILDSTAFQWLYEPDPENSVIRPLCIQIRSMLLLITVCTVLRIWHFRPDIAGKAPSNVRADMEQNAYQLARQMCMLVRSFTQTDHYVHALTFRLCLSFARNVFEQQQSIAELGWCEACLLANQLRIDRLRASSPPTLCKIDLVIPGLAEAGRYGSSLDHQAIVVRSERTHAKYLLSR